MCSRATLPSSGAPSAHPNTVLAVVDAWRIASLHGYPHAVAFKLNDEPPIFLADDEESDTVNPSSLSSTKPELPRIWRIEARCLHRMTIWRCTTRCPPRPTCGLMMLAVKTEATKAGLQSACWAHLMARVCYSFSWHAPVVVTTCSRPVRHRSADELFKAAGEKDSAPPCISTTEQITFASNECSHASVGSTMKQSSNRRAVESKAVQRYFQLVLYVLYRARF